MSLLGASNRSRRSVSALLEPVSAVGSLAMSLAAESAFLRTTGRGSSLLVADSSIVELVVEFVIRATAHNAANFS